ncbi:MAG: hypothetical protein PHP06_05990 [Clostridia bacterium]|nr:hypothetical protein [Clostridia bacterium]
MYRVLQAIMTLRNDHHLAISIRITPQCDGRTQNNITHILTYLWDKGYVQRKNIRVRKNPRNPIKHRDTRGCIYHYLLTKKGKIKLDALINLFGKLDNQMQLPPSCFNLPSDSIP